MAVKIRLKRMGKKKQPTYRVVVADSRSPRDGRIIESIGRYDPRQEPSLVEINNERAQYWLGNGAQPTERAQKLLEISGAVAVSSGRGGVYRLDTGAVEAAPPAAKAGAPAEEPAEAAAEEAPAEAAAAEEVTAEEDAGDEGAADEGGDEEDAS